MLTLLYITEFLKLLGCEPLTLGDGVDVTEMVKKCRPALVLMDLYMPGISGFDAVRNLKADAETKDVPVYAFTALDPKKLADNPDMKLFSGILPKASKIESLKQVLEAVGVILTQKSSIA